MNIPGVKKFQEKFPDYPGKKIPVMAAIAILSLSTFIILYSLSFIVLSKLQCPPAMSALISFLPVLTTVLIVTIAFLLIDSIWFSRQKLIQKYKEKALQKVYPRALVGIPMIFSILIHNILPPYRIFTITMDNRLFHIFSTPLTSLAGIPENIAIPIRCVTGLTLLLLGFRTVYCSLSTFGIDYMGLVYLYFPEESKIQNHKIYSVLRHPTYFSLLLIGYGGIALHLCLYQLIDFLCVFIGISIHIRFTEEKELLQRFGKSYYHYKKSVPWLYPKSITAYISFILGKGKQKPES